MAHPSFSLVCVVLIISSFVLGIENLKNVSNVETFQKTFNLRGLDGKIVNGTKAVVGQFPYQVSLKRKYSNMHFCGGSLISNNIVLTAAHCLFIAHGLVLILPWTVRVVAGEIQLSMNINPDHERGAVSLKLHPKYDRKTLENDIALLLLEKPFKITSTLHPIPIRWGSFLTSGTICQISGWGHTTYNGSLSTDLLYVELPIVKQLKCRQLWENISDISDGHFCAGYLEGGKDSCQGDSGGGFVCFGELTGIVSGGKGCAWPNLPGLYTNVGFYGLWITENMNNLRSSLVAKQAKNISSISNCIVCTFLFVICSLTFLL